jgi:hypothetical protein
MIVETALMVVVVWLLVLSFCKASDSSIPTVLQKKLDCFEISVVDRMDTKAVSATCEAQMEHYLDSRYMVGWHSHSTTTENSKIEDRLLNHFSPSLEKKVDAYIEKEVFIDEIIKRIKRKQVK